MGRRRRGDDDDMPRQRERDSLAGFHADNRRFADAGVGFAGLVEAVADAGERDQPVSYGSTDALRHSARFFRQIEAVLGADADLVYRRVHAEDDKRVRDPSKNSERVEINGDFEKNWRQGEV